MATFDTIESAIDDIKNGKMIIVVDDEDRENEGDFIMAADKITPDAINFMTIHGRGLICTPLTKKRAKELNLDLMVPSNDSLHETAFTVSVDSIDSGTGISTEARSLTVEALANSETVPGDLLRPGHIFPLIAKDGGVLERDGHTEAAVDLSRLAGCSPMGVICEILNEDGTMSRVDSLRLLAKKFDLKFITIKDLIKYRKKNETIIVETSSTDFPNEHGNFQLKMFENQLVEGEHHIAIVKGEFNKGDEVLVRVHSECFTGDIFGSKKCDCGDQLKVAMKEIENTGKGVLIYMRQEGRGIGLPNKIKAYHLQDQGYDTVDANLALGFKEDLRDYSLAAQILNQLGIDKVKLMTNNPLKVTGLKDYGVDVIERVAIEIESLDENHKYLMTKKDRMGHMLNELH